MKVFCIYWGKGVRKENFCIKNTQVLKKNCFSKVMSVIKEFKKKMSQI